MKTEIWVVTHKKYKEIEDDLHKTIQVGKSLGTDLGYVGDDTGDNISYKNPFYCELTGMYWLWKNYKCDIIGICHYRRFFLENTELITKDYIENILKDYDIIIPNNQLVPQNSVKEQYYCKHSAEDWEVCKQVVIEKYPEYTEAFEWMENSRTINICNMLITRKNIYDSYCQWLFDILFEVEKRINIQDKDDYQNRVMGFLSERLLKVWILANKYKVKEQSMVIMGADGISGYVEGAELKRKLFRKLTVSVVNSYINGKTPQLDKTIYELKCNTDLNINKSKENKKVLVWTWCCEGENNASKAVKKCIAGIKNNIDVSKAELHVITLDNCMEYVNLSQIIIDKFNEGKIPEKILSQRIMMELLYRYGGLWIDSQCCVVDDRINAILEKNFYTIKSDRISWDDLVVKGRWNTDVVKSNAGFSLFGMVMESFDAYYSYTDTIIDPDMADYFIEIAYEDLSDVRECIDKCEYSNENMSYIISNGNKIFRCDAWENILNDTYIFKLNNDNNMEKNIIGQTTYYGYLINNI